MPKGFARNYRGLYLEADAYLKFKVNIAQANYHLEFISHLTIRLPIHPKMQFLISKYAHIINCQVKWQAVHQKPRQPHTTVPLLGS